MRIVDATKFLQAVPHFATAASVAHQVLVDDDPVQRVVTPDHE